MTTQTDATPAISKSVTVHATQERAFRIYTERFGTWWPASHHLGQQDFAEVVVEPKAGGRWFERAADGTECDWGQVLTYQPFDRVVFAWQINGDWVYDPDLANASEVEVRFVPDGPDRTRVELEHRHFDRHGAGAASVHRGVGSPNGHQLALDQYAAEVDRAR